MTSSLQIATFVLSLIGATIATFCYLPGVIKVIKTNDTRSISSLMFGLTFFGCLMSDVYSILFLCTFVLSMTERNPNWWAFIGGFASLISTSSLGIMALIIFIKKTLNIKRAKKEGLTEDQWYKKYYQNK